MTGYLVVDQSDGALSPLDYRMFHGCEPHSGEIRRIDVVKSTDAVLFGNLMPAILDGIDDAVCDHVIDGNQCRNLWLLGKTAQSQLVSCSVFYIDGVQFGLCGNLLGKQVDFHIMPMRLLQCCLDSFISTYPCAVL